MMVGTEATGTVWNVHVRWHEADGEVQRYMLVLTPSDTGDDLFECARRSCFSCSSHARDHRFCVVQATRVGRAHGFVVRGGAEA